VVMNPANSMVTFPLEECTLLTTIPGIILFTSPGLGVECVFVAVGEYYYSHKTKSIEKRDSKRKKGEASQEKTKRSVRWKAGPNPKENSFQIASILRTFVGANSMSIYEMAKTLDMSKSRIT